MKTYILLFCLICSVGLGFSQNQASDFTGNKSDQARNPRNDLMNFVPNEVLVKFKDAVPVAAGARMKAAGVSSVDKVLQAYGATSLEKLFPTAQKPQKTRMMKSPQGKDMTIPSLDKIYRVTVPEATTSVTAPTNIFQLIEELKALPEVEYAEPNYVYSIDNMQPVGSVLTADDVAKLQTSVQKSTTNAFTPNDPLYGQQWYIPAVKADLVWEQSTGDTTQVIAILDTGVDWTHPDLKNKIWTNPNPNTTPDANGVVNDIRGWDYINNDNNPMDDNSHGTHVAGIAAAETNNGIGIAGMCPKAKIMPIKVFQSSGRGDVATIAKGIIYASTHGATVINMSFGSYARSLAMEDALANAYATSVLVAAAGNDGSDININLYSKGPFFPAALSYILGVQATQQHLNSNGNYLALFSNIDFDGPVFTRFPDLFNYEICAPGDLMISTIPNGNYRVYSGTSMAAPIISGSVALYRQIYPLQSQEQVWGNLINTTKKFFPISLSDATNAKPKPQLWFVSYEIVDTLSGDNNNKLVDAGEKIQLNFKIRNTWGQTDSVYVGLKLGEFEDTASAQIINNKTFVGSISAYSVKNSVINPLDIYINPNITHNREIVFEAQLWALNSSDTIKQQIVLKVENGQELPGGIVDTIITLTPDKRWLVNKPLKFTSNGGMIILPGTHITVNQSLSGIIKSDGTRDSLIIFEGNGQSTITGNSFSYCSLSRVNSIYGNCKNCIIESLSSKIQSKSLINNKLMYCTMELYPKADSIIDNVFFNCSSFTYPFTSYSGIGGDSNGGVIMKRNNFINYSVSIYPSEIPGLFKYNNFVSVKGPFFSLLYDNYNGITQIKSEHTYNNFIKSTNIFQANSGSNVIKWNDLYWGTTKIDSIRNTVVDFWSNINLSMFNFSPMLTAPSDSAHAIVWKVLVNGKDAQDEVVDPVGVGKQRFDVYFNRAMDKTIIPQVSFGVRYPYSQQVVNEDGVWSDGGKIYTVYKNIKLTTGDGINRIRVAGAKEVNGWDNEIPVEDQRFNFVISAAGSASAEFMASAGLGKVKLEWNNSDLQDGLGYNMYRMEHINDSTLTSPILINSTLITDTLYTDFAVTPNKKYYYYYKILRTNLAETDSSKVVSATPFTASKGDANGDLSVNVLDVTSIVAYLLNNNPQPFIFEAADVNSDATINVLDIVGVVNKVLNGAQKVRAMGQDKLVDLFLENDTLFANSNTPIGGIQLDIKGVSSIDEIQTLKALDGFESGNSIISDSLRLIFYSMSGKNIPAGERIPLLKLKSGSKILNAIFGETNGSPIKVNYILTRIPDIQSNMNQTIAELGQNYPNPVNGKTIIPIRIYEPVNEVILQVVNLMGQEVDVIHLENPYIGEHKLEWNPKQNKGLFIYTLKVTNGKQKNVCPAKQMIVQ